MMGEKERDKCRCVGAGEINEELSANWLSDGRIFSINFLECGVVLKTCFEL